MSTDGHLTIGQCGSKDGLKVDRVTDDQARYRIEGMDGCLLDQLPARMNVVIKQGVMEIRSAMTRLRCRTGSGVDNSSHGSGGGGVGGRAVDSDG